MYYAPHILQLKKEVPAQYDEDGNPLTTESSEWETVGTCRCDDNGTSRQISMNGQMYDYSYHIVFDEGNIDAGDYVRALDESGSVRGEGEVLRVSVSNYFNYRQLWV